MAEDNDNPASPPANPIRDAIYARLYPEVEKSVNDGVEEEKNKIRNGDGSFWGFLKGLIFQLAEKFGFDKWLASMFDMHIPEENEKKALTEQVTASVSDVLTAKDANGKPLAAQMTPEQLQQAVSERVSYDLKHNQVVAAAFTPENIAKIAQKAGENAADKIDTIRSVISPAQPAATNVQLTGTPDQQVGQTLGSMADGILNSSLIPKDKQAEAAAVKPTMVEIGTKIIMAHPDLIGKPDQLAKLYTDELQKNPAANEGLKKLGMDINDEKIKPLIAQILQDNLTNYGDLLTKATQGKAAGIEPPKPAATDYRKIIADKINENIVEQAAQNVLQKVNGGGFTGWYVSNDAVNKAADALNKYNATPPANDQEKAERQTAVQTLYRRAVDLNHAPNTAQRQKIAATVADAAIATLKNPANKNLSQPQMADLMQATVSDALIRNTPSIDALGNSIADMNKYYFTANDDLIGNITKGVGDKLRDANDPDKIYSMLKMAQASLLGPDPAATLAAASGIKGSTTGVSGGEDAHHIVASLAFGSNGKPNGRNVGGNPTHQPGTPGSPAIP